MKLSNPLHDYVPELRRGDSTRMPINRLRITITSSCNFKCFFCHKEGLEEPRNQEMSISEIGKLVKIAASLGIDIVKLVGGEALIRRDLEETVSVIAHYVKEVSLTTNGFGFVQRAAALKQAGLSRVNISLHSLTREGFKKITGVDAFDSIMASIEKAIEQGFEKVKVNLTLMRGVNDHELLDFIAWAAELGVELQIIELQPSDAMSVNQFGRLHYDLRKLRSALIADISENGGDADQVNDKYTVIKNGKSVVISLLRLCNDSSGCASSGSLQVTSDGKLKPCFWRNDNLVDVRELIQEPTSPCLKCGLMSAARAVEDTCSLEREVVNFA